LVDTTTSKVDEYGDQYYDAKDAARAEGLGVLVYTTACEGRAAFEEVRAVVYRSDKGYTGFRKRVRVAKQRDDGSLATLNTFGGLLLVSVMSVIIIVVAINNLARVKGGGFERALGFRGQRGAERTSCVV
jgi:hypothetical protein